MTSEFHTASMAVHHIVDLAALRGWLIRELQGSSWDGQLADLTLAVHEAAKNALAFSDGRPAHVTLHVGVASVVVCVADSGPGFAPGCADLLAFPEVTETSGRGLPLIHGMVDAVEIDSQPGHTVIRMRQRLDEAVG